MTLKICHLISGDLWAGAEVMAFHLLNSLKTIPGVDLFVVLLNKGRLSEELKSLGIPVYVIDESKRSFLEIAGMAVRILRKWAPHILHSHRYKENILSFLISMALREKVALISTQHGMPEFYDGSPSLLRRLKLQLNYRLLASKIDRTVAVSMDIKKSLVRDYGFQEKRIETIHNGIIVSEMSCHSKSKHDFVIGSAGRFFPVKDYPFMVEVAKEVVAKTSKIRFELAGEGPMLGVVQGLIRSYELEERFALRGFLHDASTFYQGLDVYLNTSLHEGIPMSVLEAMANGVPVIVPKVGGLEELVTDGVDGYLVDTRNPRDFADRCLCLYENDTLWQKMAHAAREKIIREFSTQQMVDDYVAMYMQVIKKNWQPKHRRRFL